MRILKNGEKVRVNTEQSLSHKLDAAGHICVVMAFEPVADSRVSCTSDYRYILGWRYEDNLGKEYPSCIDAYWFFIFWFNFNHKLTSVFHRKDVRYTP